ncbi:membrane dipeptidase [Streptomyces sp. NPDC047014]|uniref:membrane dipeptidase n=1 Tax=Streptomyces sp. NPDC047014 TaxID=3155736 RepID=UPI0033E3E834
MTGAHAMADLQDDPHAVGIGADDLPAPAAASTLDRAAALLAVHPVVDGCNTLVWTLRQSPYLDIETSDAGVDTDIPRLRAGGVGAQFWSLLVPPDGPSGAGATDQVVADTLEQIDAALALLRRYPDSLRLALSADDLADARNRGRIASFLGPVPGRTLTDSLGALRAFHALGVRSLAPAGAPWAREGLTAFGHEVVREANRLAVLLDLTGCPSAVARRIAAASKAPVIISNTGAAALTPHPDNADDEVLTALREANGLAMVTFDTARTGDSLHAVADHLDHVRAVAGPECVGLGAAFGTERAALHPTGLTDPSGYPRLIAELLERGWTEPELSLLTWGNAQRVIRDTEFTARRSTH